MFDMLASERKIDEKVSWEACCEAMRYLFEIPRDFSLSNLKRDKLLSYGLRPTKTLLLFCRGAVLSNQDNLSK